MTKISLFRPRADIDAALRLEEFVRYSREELTWLSDRADFDWFASEWPFARWTKVFVGKRRRVGGDEILDAGFIDFAKAYFRYKNTERPTLTKWEVAALKCMEAALLSVTGSSSLQGLSFAVLDAAAFVAREHFTSQARYHVGRTVSDIARFVSEKRLVPIDVALWKSPIVRPSSVRRTGRLGQAEIERKLPTQAGMDAMAEIFANNPEEPRALFISAVWALLMSAPWRISELLTLHVDAEYEGRDDDGVVSYGLRYYGAKGFEHSIKWIPKVMEPLARAAFRRIKALTDTARSLASHLEVNPNQPFLHSDAPEAGVDDELTLGQKAAYLRYRVPKTGRRQPPWDFRSIRDHWERSRTKLPSGFPVFDEKTGLKWRVALFCMHWDVLSVSRTDWYRLGKPHTNAVNDLLGTRGGRRSVARELGYREPDGTVIRLTTHQARHFLSTVAERGGMAQEELAKWAGRANLKDNAVYNHMSEEEHVQRDRELLERSGLYGGGGAMQVKDPTTPTEADNNATGPTHRTAFGMCEHDWVMSPCTKHGDCISCTEHAYAKGDEEVHGRLKEKYESDLAECEKALDALKEGTSVADRWLEHALKSLMRQQQLFSLLESDDIEDGAVIRLSDKRAEHTHLRRELDQGEPQSRDRSLLAEIGGLITRVKNGEALIDVARSADRVAVERMADGHEAHVEATDQADRQATIDTSD